MSSATLTSSASNKSLFGAVRGWGRLYAESPLKQYTEEEMVREAQLRQEHNRQRRRMKQMLSAASSDGSNVATKDLLLAAKIANMDLPDGFVQKTPHVTSKDSGGAPTSIAWKPFYSSLPAPPLKGAGGFDPDDLPTLR